MEDKRMIVHIFQYKLYTKGFIDFIREKYPFDEHTFIVYGKCPNENFKINEDNGVNFISVPVDIVREKKLCRLAEDAEKLIVHSNNLLITKLYLKKPSWLKKTYIVFWGFDIYCYRKKAAGIKNKIYTQIQKWQIRNVKAVCTLADKDKTVLDDLIPKIKGKHFYAVYMATTDYDKFFELRKFNKSSNPYKIIVGNSATETNQHKEILDVLAKYKDENLIIYCPLSYGGEEYRNQIIEYGRGIFGNKFVPLTELMPLEKYWELLNECIAGFYNNNRQQGMGNISILLGLGAKVYIRSDTSMWQRYNDRGYKVYDIEEIADMDWHDVIAFNENMQMRNSDIHEKSISLATKKKVWDNIFNS